MNLFTGIPNCTDHTLIGSSTTVPGELSEGLRFSPFYPATNVLTLHRRCRMRPLHEYPDGRAALHLGNRDHLALATPAPAGDTRQGNVVDLIQEITL